MKWLFIVFLLLNICYFGWELDRQTRIEVSNSVRPFYIPVNTPRLELLKELENSPDTASNKLSATIDDELTNQEISPLQNIASMMEQGNVMIEKKVIDELAPSFPEFSKNNALEPKAKKILCVSFGPFAEEQQADELSNWLKEREIHTNKRTKGGKQDQYFWIYLSASESENEAMAAIEDLKGKGVKDYKLINKGNLQNAISLGLFSTQSAVNKRLNELKDIGYQPVIVPYHQNQSIIWVNARVDANDANQGNVLSEFIDGYPSRFNSIPVRCEELFDALETT